MGCFLHNDPEGGGAAVLLWLPSDPRKTRIAPIGALVLPIRYLLQKDAFWSQKVRWLFFVAQRLIAFQTLTDSSFGSSLGVLQHSPKKADDLLYSSTAL